MKKFLAMFLTVALLMTGVSSVSAENDDIKVTLNGTPITFDVPPQIINNRTMVPLRAVFEAMGAMVMWWEDNLTPIEIQLNGKDILLGIENDTMTIINGQGYRTEVWLDSPPCIIDSRTLVPVRAISEALDAYIKWNETNKTVEIDYPQISPVVFSDNQISTLEGLTYFLPLCKKEDILTKEYAFDFISSVAFNLIGNPYNAIVEYKGTRWMIAGSRDELNDEYNLLFGCDMPFFTEDEFPEWLIMYNGQYAVEESYGGWDTGPKYHHTEVKPDGSYDVVFMWYRTLVFNISFSDNENGFIINSFSEFDI